MLIICEVTHCIGHALANTRPHQLRWGDREMGTAISCIECSKAWSSPKVSLKLQFLHPVVLNEGLARPCRLNNSSYKMQFHFFLKA